ncbi:MAG TPA: hypothetical protein VM120_09915 [Bryobacteraceae bacterium]|nr:hypothetical protein [Bryobacteraceae bacterium]
MEQVNDNPQPVGYCRFCGKALAQDQVNSYQGTYYCAEHLPRTEYSAASSGTTSAAASPNAARILRDGPSPGLAFVFGLIPGVGAIYNGQYAKGFVHVLIAGLLFSLAGRDSGAMEPFFEMFIPVWFFYMAFEAYHTAKKRLAGEPVDEFSSIFPSTGVGTGFPILPLLLIALGVLFLLNNLEIIRIRQLMPYAGPIFLIGLGCYMLYARSKSNAEAAREVSHGGN